VSDFLIAIIELFFASSYGWDVISRYWSKSAHYRGGGSLLAQILGGRGRRLPTIVVIRKQVFLLHHSEDRVILCSFVWIGYQRVSEGRTDRRNCSSYYSALHIDLQAMRPRCKNDEMKNVDCKTHFSWRRYGNRNNCRLALYGIRSQIIEILRLKLNKPCLCYLMYIVGPIYDPAKSLKTWPPSALLSDATHWVSHFNM